MRRPAWLCAGPVCLTALLSLMLPSVGRAQNKSEEVQFETADGVELRGTFYSPGKAKAPCVILLHKYGGNRQQQGWDELAQSLQKDFAVLSFDFRGHGDSKNINDARKFWGTRANAQFVRGNINKQKIDSKDFSNGYLPMLVNDVAAAKRYLDNQNDALVCNASNVIVIGAQEGAGIGALWIAAEWRRKPLVLNAFGRPVEDPMGKPAGEDIAGAVWLSIPSAVGNAPLAYALAPSGFNAPPIRDKVPMVFIYGDKDNKQKHASEQLFNALKRAGRGQLTATKLRPKETQLAGASLLGKKFSTDQDISNYLTNVMDHRGVKGWTRRDPDRGLPPQLLNLRPLGLPFP